MDISPSIADQAAAVRAFNRFYTQRIGVLDDAPLGGPFSLTEGRVLYELGNRNAPVANELCRDLALDRGYLSRILKRFQKQGLVERSRSDTDRRQSHIRLTSKGITLLASIDGAWQSATEKLIAPLGEAERQGVVSAMGRIRTVLETVDRGRQQTPVMLREHRLGDMGWIIQRHATVYGAEYGWNDEFEALVAEICAKFVRECDPTRERCWIATIGGAPAGCIFLVRDSDEIGRLRLLFVDPTARGRGVGRLLVDACIAEARRVGYSTLTLWTNDVLASARRIYQAAGFNLVREWPDRKFGKDLVGQDWDLDLKTP